MAAPCELNADANVSQVKDYNSGVHSNETALSGSNRLRSQQGPPESVPGEINARRHCSVLIPMQRSASARTFATWKIQPSSIVLSPPQRDPSILPSPPHLKIALRQFPCPARPPLPGLLSFKLFHFTNICWQKEIPNLPRGFLSNSIIETECRFGLLLMLPWVFFFLFHSSLYFNGFMKNNNLMPTIH